MKSLKIFACLAAVFCAAPGLRAQAPVPATETVSVLTPGDAVRITVWRKPELTGEFALAANGTILHPLYRDVQVTGVPMATVESRVLEYLRRLDSNPQFVIEPLYRVAVSGEVRKPDLYSLAPVTTLAQAVALAGGPTERGQLTRVRLLRDGRQQVVDLTRPDAGEAANTIRSGDQLLVPRRVSVFRDYIAPASGLMATAVSLIALLTRKQ